MKETLVELRVGGRATSKIAAILTVCSLAKAMWDVVWRGRFGLTLYLTMGEAKTFSGSLSSLLDQTKEREHELS